jgi:hypothetical protein
MPVKYFLCYTNPSEMEYVPDAGDEAKADAEIKKATTPPVRSTWGIGEIKRKLHKRKTKYKHETPADKAARRTANATVCIAAFTVVLAVVGGITLFEIWSGGADTAKLAQAAVDQAGALKLQEQRMETMGTAASAQAIASIDQVDKLEAGVKETHALAEQAKRSADISANGLAQAQKALDATTANARLDRRAWVGINTLTVVQFVKDKSLRVDIGFFNSGRTPALKVSDGSKFIFSKTYVPGPDSTWPMNFLMEPQTSVPPQGTFARHIEMDQQVVGPRYDDIKAGKEILYFYGQLIYTDTSETVSGVTQFCIFLRMVDDKPDLAFCPNFNDLK